MADTWKLKSWPWFYSAMVSDQKKHDVRDGRERNFKVGDFIILEEFDPRTGQYTGRSARFIITYITSQVTPCALSSAVLQPGYVILSVEAA